MKEIEMKKYTLLLFLLLSGCTFYECINDEYQKKSFCIWKNDYDTLISENIEREHIFDVIKSSDPHGKNCSTRPPDIVDFIRFPMNTYQICSDYNLEEWKSLEKDFLEKEKQRLQDEQEYQEWYKQQEIREKGLKKKSGGKDFCDPSEVKWYDLPTYCMFPINEYSNIVKVLQQNSQGTLVYTSHAPEYVYLIEKNKIDSVLVDEQSIPSGVFIVSGKFQYTSLLGATKTIRKLKRLE